MIEVHRVTSVDLRVEPGGWSFAEAERPRIAAHWAAIVAAKPQVWNGQVLICTRAVVRDGHLEARYARTDYASFVAWRDWGWPDPAARNCFGVAVVVSADHALLYGVMAETTLNPGRSFPPSGSLEQQDVTADGSVDIFGSMSRELAEETSLDLAAMRAGETYALFDGRRLAVARLAYSAQTYAALEAQAAAFIAAQPESELVRVEAIRSPADIGARMPPYAQEIVRRHFAAAWPD